MREFNILSFFKGKMFTQSEMYIPQIHDVVKFEKWIYLCNPKSCEDIEH